MGGNALKKIEVSRLDREEFIEVCSSVIHKLSKVYGAEKGDIRILPFYKDKESFGDIDLLIANELIKDKNNFNKKLKDEIGAKEISSSADFHIHPFAFNHKGKNYQVDLMFHPRSEIERASLFYGYNDLHVLVSQFAMPKDNHLLNLSFNRKGLVKNIYYDSSKNNKIGEIVVEKDFYKILDYLGLDSSKHKKGFSSLEKIFDFILESHNFDYKSMKSKIEEPSNDTKKRLKRDNFNNFIKYSEQKEQKRADKIKGSISYFNSFFPNVLKEEKEILEKYEDIKKYKKYLDGNEISDISGLSVKDKRLGFLCKKIREIFNNSDENMVEWIKSHDEKDRIKLINDQKELILVEYPDFVSPRRNKL